MDRDADFMATGKRHCFYYQYDVGFDDEGRIQAAKVDMISRAGYSTDLSPPVASRAMCHFDNAYFLSDVSIKAMCGKTNTQSNTAFRGFGGPQGAIAIEYIIDDIARLLDQDPLTIRKNNFYNSIQNTTPYQQIVKDNVIHEVVGEIEQSSDYIKRKEIVRAFNRRSPVINSIKPVHWFMCTPMVPFW